MQQLHGKMKIFHLSWLRESCGEKIKTVVVESYINLSFISEKTILVSKFNNKQVQIDDGVKVPLLFLTITNRA